MWDLLQHTPCSTARAAKVGTELQGLTLGETPPSTLCVSQELTLLVAVPLPALPTFSTRISTQPHKRRARGLQGQAVRTRYPHGPAVRRPHSPRSTPLQWRPRPGSGDRRNGQQFLQCFWRQDPGPAAGPARANRKNGISERPKDNEHRTPLFHCVSPVNKLLANQKDKGF